MLEKLQHSPAKAVTDFTESPRQPQKVPCETTTRLVTRALSMKRFDVIGNYS